MQLKRNGTQFSVKGNTDWFTGEVRIDPLFAKQNSTKAAGALVTFEPGARTAWHTHPAGQTLIVVSGLGWVQKEGEQLQEIYPGDVIYFEPNEKHWHGASRDKAMSHIAIQEEVNGEVVTWMEKVGDDQYKLKG
ncbi:(R)-mandelonitrile lyase [Pedobacter sp. AW31-3R]|uniref:(R)-mandelonitrile lyase n=1 Tax=Pedobacter sp. AW31-3R TaxID=3445781 RepID=UPI003FA0717B